MSQVYRVEGFPSIFTLSAAEYNSSDIQARKNAVFLVNFNEAAIADKISWKKSEK